ncbi:MAG: VWA domain-containing protein [Bryobacteraceae bacterium]
MRTMLLLLAPVLAAQTVSEPTLRITVNLVQVDAVVTDSHGKRVTDLTKDDFVILQDGKPHKVTHCTYFAEPPAAPIPAAVKAPAGGPVAVPALKPSQTRRVVALVVDDLGMAFSSVHFARQALRQWVDEQMQPGDLVSIVRTGANAGTFQQFTNDKRLLHAAIDRARWNGLGRADSDAVKEPDVDLETISQEMRGEIEKEILKNENLQHEMSSVGTVGALTWVVQGLQQMPGRKSVILLSDGFKMWIQEKTGPNEFRRALDRLSNQLRNLTDLANRTGVAIHTIDARGLMTGRPGAKAPTAPAEVVDLSSVTNNWDGLRFLAQETGGLFTKNDNDLPGAVDKSVEDQNGYYMLGYNPGPDTFQLKKGKSKYHRVTVKVTRPGLEVRSRAGFLGVPDEPRMDTGQAPGRSLMVNRERLLLESIASPFQAEGIRLHLAALFGNASDSGSYVHAMVHIDARDLAFVQDGPGYRKATVDVVLATFDADSEAKGSVAKDHNIRVSDAGYERMLQHGYLYDAMLALKKAGAYQFRVGVRDVSSGKFGSASQFVFAPDVSNGQLVLSGVSLDNRLAAGTQAYSSQPALRVFRHGEPIYCGVMVYNAGGVRGARRPEVEMQVRVLRDGRMVWRGEPYPLKVEGQSDPGRVPFVQKLSFGPRTPAGSYVIQVSAINKAAPAKRPAVTQWMDFELTAAQ